MHERDLNDSEDHHECARRLLAHYGATKKNKYQQLGSILTCYRPIMTSSISLREVCVCVSEREWVNV